MKPIKVLPEICTLLGQGGKLSVNYVNRALRLDPNNPQILFDKGNFLYYPPKVFGGNKKEAFKYFLKAISILERQNKTQYNWVYLQLLVVAGHSYELLGDYNRAEQYSLKVLKIAPDFKTVKDNLYPKLKTKIQAVN